MDAVLRHIAIMPHNALHEAHAAAHHHMRRISTWRPAWKQQEASCVPGNA